MRISKIVPFVVATAFLAAPALAQDTNALARENFDQADANDDGKLSPTEFRVFIDENAKDEIGRAAMVKRFGAYDRAFATLDQDEDGFVSGAELRAARQ